MARKVRPRTPRLAPKPARAKAKASPFAAFLVHIFTASGAVLALLALLAASGGRWTEMFLWLSAAFVIDGIDGTFARWLRVGETLPRWSGDVLDLVVDFLTYVFIPAYALAAGPLLPPAFALIAASAVLISGAIYFSDLSMKTGDWHFRGFPAIWNVLVFYLFLLKADPYVALAIVTLFVALTFAPLRMIHPFRVRKWMRLNLFLLAAWVVLSGIALAMSLNPPLPVVLALLLIAVYFLFSGSIHPGTRKT
jgi:phosphatidylcholine synthase